MFGAITRFAPGLDALRQYDRSWITSDIVAGLSIAAVALPVGIALAEVTGVPSVYGIYAAIFPLFAYALFGASRMMIIGPDTATCVLVAASLVPLADGDPQQQVALMVMLSLITGVFLIIGAVLRLGFVANFLSQPILTGFLNGLALVMISGQLKTLCGYSGNASGFVMRLVEFGQNVWKSHIPTLLIGVGLMLLLIAGRRFYPRLPSILIILVLGGLLVFGLGLEQKGVAVIGTIPSGLPSPSIDFPSWSDFRMLLADGGAVALLVFISGILAVRAFAHRSREEIDSTQELLGLGIANIVSGVFQGFAVSGTTSRTVVNYSAGGKSRVAGIVAALVMLLVLMFLAGPFAYIPRSALAAALFVAGFSLFDYAALRELWTTNRIEFAVCMVAMLGVLIMGVLPGVGLAIGLALAWLLYVESNPSDAILGRIKGMKGYYDVNEYPEAITVPGLIVYRFNADLVFFNADRFKQRVRGVVSGAETAVEWLVLDASSMNYVDVTAIKKVDELAAELSDRGVRIVVVNLKSHVLRPFKQEWVKGRLERGAAKIFPTIRTAINAFEQSRKQAAIRDSSVTQNQA